MTRPEAPWAMGKKQILDAFATDASAGLTAKVAAERLRESGPNTIVEVEPPSFVEVALEELREPMILLLIFVGIVYSVWGSVWDALTIFAVILTLVLVEVYNEYRTDKTLATLRQLSAPTTLVTRDGSIQDMAAENLVPGDLLILRVGQKVPADARLLEALGLAVDQSSLTGESVPVEKDAEGVLTDDASIGERTNMVFAGTAITRGRGRAVVTATGMNTEIGRIAGLVKQVKEPKTPLQLSMKQLAGSLLWIAVFFSAAIPVAGVLQGRPLQQMVLTGLSLAFAVIPEELPIIITMVLALGALSLSRRHALVKHLKAAETLGEVTAIVTDKTGTLTENRMRLVTLQAADATASRGIMRLTENELALLEVGAVVNDAAAAADASLQGDPIDVALLEATEEAYASPDQLRRRWTVRQEYTFDNSRKLMSEIAEREGETYALVKGAPEKVLERSVSILEGRSERVMSPEDRVAALGKVEDLARGGLRLLAFGRRRLSKGEPVTRESVEAGLTYLGMAGFLDPPRKEAQESVSACRHAGIRLVMVTGDHELTALNVARTVGIDTSGGVVTGNLLDKMDDQELRSRLETTSVYARTTPEHKLRIVEALKAKGDIVAVTGDGVNDAPALKRADIGVAMGKTGTEVAREASDIVLMDDNFATVALAVREGRRLFDNLRKGVRYYLACKLALISIFVLPVLLGIPLPFAPIQIIILELFMDIAASSAYVAEPAERDLMTRGPRNRGDSFIDRSVKTSIFFGSLSLFAAVTTVYLSAMLLGRDALEAQTMAFATWLLGHVLLALNMRTNSEPLGSIGYLSNKTMVLWAISVVLTLAAMTNIQWLQEALRTTTLSGSDWLLVSMVALLATFWIDLRKHLVHGGLRHESPELESPAKARA